MRSIQKAKAAAKQLRNEAARMGCILSIKDSQQVIARQAGCQSWQELARTLPHELTVAELLTWLHYIQEDLGHRPFWIGVIDTQWRLVTTLNVDGLSVSKGKRIVYLHAGPIPDSISYGVASTYEILKRLPKQAADYTVELRQTHDVRAISIRRDSLWKHWSVSPGSGYTGFANVLLADSTIPAKPGSQTIGYCDSRNPDLPITVPPTVKPENDLHRVLIRAGATPAEAKKLQQILMPFPEGARAFYTWAIEDILRCRRARGEMRYAIQYLLDTLVDLDNLRSISAESDQWLNLDIPWQKLRFSSHFVDRDRVAAYRDIVRPLVVKLKMII